MTRKTTRKTNEMAIQTHFPYEVFSAYQTITWYWLLMEIHMVKVGWHCLTTCTTCCTGTTKKSSILEPNWAKIKQIVWALQLCFNKQKMKWYEDMLVIPSPSFWINHVNWGCRWGVWVSKELLCFIWFRNGVGSAENTNWTRVCGGNCKHHIAHKKDKPPPHPMQRERQSAAPPNTTQKTKPLPHPTQQTLSIHMQRTFSKRDTCSLSSGHDTCSLNATRSLLFPKLSLNMTRAHPSSKNLSGGQSCDPTSNPSEQPSSNPSSNPLEQPRSNPSPNLLGGAQFTGGPCRSTQWWQWQWWQIQPHPGCKQRVPLIFHLCRRICGPTNMVVVAAAANSNSWGKGKKTIKNQKQKYGGKEDGQKCGSNAATAMAKAMARRCCPCCTGIFALIVVAMAPLPLLRWHCCPYCATAVVALALMPLLHWWSPRCCGYTGIVVTLASLPHCSCAGIAIVVASALLSLLHWHLCPCCSAMALFPLLHRHCCASIVIALVPLPLLRWLGPCPCSCTGIVAVVAWMSLTPSCWCCCPCHGCAEVDAAIALALVLLLCRHLCCAALLSFRCAGWLLPVALPLSLASLSPLCQLPCCTGVFTVVIIA